MSKRAFPLLLLISLATRVSAAASDPFVGEWKLDPSKSSKIMDQMRVDRVGGDKYVFDFGGGREAIAADGTDQAGGSGTILSATVQAPDSLKIVRKKDGRALLSANWKLSKDGKMLIDDYTEFAPDGSLSTVRYVYERTAGTSGFAGTWTNTTGSMIPAFVMKVQPYEEDGLSFIVRGVAKNVKFDGRDHPNASATGAACSARRVNDRTLERTDKLDGKVTDTRKMTVSVDGRTLEMTVHKTGSADPIRLVLERQ
jgi:hypothetical protein